MTSVVHSVDHSNRLIRIVFRCSMRDLLIGKFNITVFILQNTRCRLWCLFLEQLSLPKNHKLLYVNLFYRKILYFLVSHCFHACSMNTSSRSNINVHICCYFCVSDRLSTGIAVADIDLSLIDSVRAKMPIAKVSSKSNF